MFMKKYWMPLPKDHNVCMDIINLLDDCGIINHSLMDDDERRSVVFWSGPLKVRKFNKKLDEIFFVHPKIVAL